MKKIGIFICNYNGKQWCIGCIRSLLLQSISLFDIYVVDNNSTDGSVNALKKEFSERIHIIQNSKNLGGAGGFNRGLTYGLEHNYDYIALLDNDIKLESHFVENMYNYLEHHENVGIVGSKVMIMDNPELIQDYGCKLDFENYCEIPLYRFKKESEVPLEHECDYVPTCAVMIRASVLKKTGGMPEDNFIYYDDIELSYKIKSANYKVIALGNTKVFHKGGFRKVINSFPRYYFLRNRLNFFAKYLDENKIDDFVERTLRDLYYQFTGYYLKEKKELLITTLYAFLDFLSEIRFEALPGRILDLKDQILPFETLLKDKKRICIDFCKGQNEEPDFIFFLRLIYIIQKNSYQEQICVNLEKSGYDKNKFLSVYSDLKKDETIKLPTLEFVSLTENLCFDLHLRMCSHINKIDENILPCVWVDPFFNCISNEDEYKFVLSFPRYFDFFCKCYKPLFLNAISHIRKSSANQF